MMIPSTMIFDFDIVGTGLGAGGRRRPSRQKSSVNPPPLTNRTLHGMQTPSSEDNSVCPSVKRVICDKMEK